MVKVLGTALLALLPQATVALRWQMDQIPWNLNQNPDATQPTEYWGEWQDHQFNPSPENWRFPFYALTQDRFVDGDPTNNEANGTQFEHDWTTNQLRFGGDLKGIQSSLDYLQGFGIRGIYLTGSPFLNMPWAGHGYGPLDFTLLDRHHGVIQDWRDTINDIHRRGMYVILDNTMSTMADLLGFQGYENSTSLTPFNWGEYDYFWKMPERQYHDFHPHNEINESCVYPRMWDIDGMPLAQPYVEQEQIHKCRASEFDSYGAIEGVGQFPVWENELAKFASVQDRLREWQPSVLEKIKVMSCIQIAMLDIDGFRMDKGVQITPDAQASFAAYQRQCARRYGKENFLIVGEVVANPNQSPVHIGRGKQADSWFEGPEQALLASSNDSYSSYLREFGMSALDGSAFEYDTYGSMTRFLGMSGWNGRNGVDFTDIWHRIASSNDMVNPSTGQYDPRTMFGMTSQDVFRWPALDRGAERQGLGFLITMLQMPGIPLVLYGEEQTSYILENTDSDYLFGRLPMASQRAWQLHGCYHLGADAYYEPNFTTAANGCNDLSVSLDHRDPSHPMRNLLSRMFELRRQYPTLNDGFNVTRLSKATRNVYYPGNDNYPSETGLWSVYRGRAPRVQDLSGSGAGNQAVWLLYHNENHTIDYSLNCSSSNSNDSVTAPFGPGTTVKNLFYPYDEYTLEATPFELELDGLDGLSGCISNFTIDAWGFKAFVPKQTFVDPIPQISRVIPGHDARLKSTVDLGQQETVPLQIRFSQPMDCDSVTNSISVDSTTQDGSRARIDPNSISCRIETQDKSPYVGGVSSEFTFAANLVNVGNGIHAYTVSNVTTQDGQRFTDSTGRFMLRVGQENNPVVFPWSGNYTRNIYHKDEETGALVLTPNAAGADLFRYSTNFGSSYTDWMPYNGQNVTIEPQAWNGTNLQAWNGDHLQLTFWSQLAGSADHVQHTDVEDRTPRRWPHAFVQGQFNQFGFDGGLNGEMDLDPDTGLWEYDLSHEWPTQFLINVWGMNPDGLPDKTQAFGDVDGDGILDVMEIDTLTPNVANISNSPPRPYLGYRIQASDANMSYHLTPVGSDRVQLAFGLLLAVVPILTGALTVFIYVKGFYQVKFNEIGITEKNDPLAWLGRMKPGRNNALREAVAGMFERGNHSGARLNEMQQSEPPSPRIRDAADAIEAAQGAPNRRHVLIATMEYIIEDWNISVKIGGLGVMAALMSKNLGHQDVTWVVPCCSGIDYPIDEPANSMWVSIMGEAYEVKVQYHKLRNITFVLIDAPVFRKQTKKEPYPPRMDDLDSGVYYSAWNQCIAQAIDRFNPDLYHINDYHGTLALLYLLPRTIPCIYSLHNAEFQGLWPLRTAAEKAEICSTFNLPRNVVEKYVQFGEVFNLLHAGASYLRIHQKGYGAIGVSTKYGKRAFARYPCLWGLQGVGGLPNPDPSDTAALTKDTPPPEPVVNEEYEASRGDTRKQAQEWAGLSIDPEAELFVFVGRWSYQKGVDLIADIFFPVLEENPKVQLICVGPMIDLYGKFAAVKLGKMMEKYPGRVYSKPEFVALPPFIFSGAEFALIPSRDEPFGLVAVEFGRKGALGVGARVGGLGQMPGWWFTIESIATQHLLKQFKLAIRGALASRREARAMMRARSNLQRFPVLQWVEDYEKLQNLGISSFKKVASRPASILRRSGSSTPAGGLSGFNTPGWQTSAWQTPLHSAPPTAPSSIPPSRTQSRAASPERGAILTGDKTNMGRACGPSNAANGSLLRTSSFHGLLPMASRRISPTTSRRSSVATVYSATEDSSGDGYGQQRPVAGLSRVRSTIPEGNETEEDRGSTETGSSGTCAHERASNDSVQHSANQSQEASPQGSTSESSGDQSLTEKIRGALPKDLSGLPSIRESTLNRRPRPAHLKLNTRTQPLTSPPLSPMVSSPSSPSGIRTPVAYDPVQDSAGQPRTSRPVPGRTSSALDLSAIRPEGGGEKKNYDLQRVEPFFTDPTGFYSKKFIDKLETINARNSTKSLCIEDYLKTSEKAWFGRLHNAKLGKSSEPKTMETRVSAKRTKSILSSFTRSSKGSESDVESTPTSPTCGSMDAEKSNEQFQIDSDYKAPRYLRSWLQTKIGDWQLYTFILAFGQIIALQSYQVTLLTGQVGETANKLYILASVYLGASVLWYLLFRVAKAIHVLALPFIAYGIAFFLLGMGPYVSDYDGRGWLNNVATGVYAFASASGTFYFALNFGTEGGSPTQSWVYRACVVSGTQSIYVAGLWYWGSELANVVGAGLPASSNVPMGPKITAITTPIAVFLWMLGVVLYLGLPNYYRQKPGRIPSFYRTVATRKIILWFFVTVILQNYWLSAPFGRNWRFLWTTNYAPAWTIALLVVLFFIVVWAIAMGAFHTMSKTHSWILPMFAIGLGAPRWAQMLWGVSGLGMYVPWGGPLAGALLSRSLWLWLGVLDSLQGVGFGMILLQTLSRYYVVFALVVAQVIGSVATIVARATAPDNTGPGDVFPNFALNAKVAVGKGDFWGCLVCQVAICVGFAVFFRKEQLFKP